MPDIHILVVDDFLPWQRFVMDTCETEADLKIISIASDGWEAIQKAKALRPDLILMDINLASISGLEATREIRVLSPASKVLFVSADPRYELVEAAFEAGASGYVVKSDSCSDLITGIRAVLHGHRFVSRSLRNWSKL
jgi:DNA-binding NarL/FixJ family response regulator